MKSFDIFNYFDPGELLRDAYTHKKRMNRKWTYQAAAAKAGLKSTGNMADMVQGRVDVPVNMASNLARAFEMNKQETEYFTRLVKYSRSKNHEERENNFKALLKIRHTKIKTLEKSQYDYFNKWYYLAVRELLEFYPFRADYADLAKQLVPSITPAQAKKAIQVLEKLGLIQKGPSGVYEKCEAVVTAGEWKSLAITGLQLSMVDLIRHSLDRVPASDRSISNLTLSISKDTAARIKGEIALFRKRLLDLALEDKHPDRVYQINFSAFPLSKLPESPSGDGEEKK